MDQLQGSMQVTPAQVFSSRIMKSLWWDRKEQTVGLSTTSTVKRSRFNLEAKWGWEVFSEFLSRVWKSSMWIVWVKNRLVLCFFLVSKKILLNLESCNSRGKYPREEDYERKRDVNYPDGCLMIYLGSLPFLIPRLETISFH